MRGIVLLCVADAEHKFYGDWAHNMASGTLTQETNVERLVSGLYATLYPEE